MELTGSYQACPHCRDKTPTARYSKEEIGRWLQEVGVGGTFTCKNQDCKKLIKIGEDLKLRSLEKKVSQRVRRLNQAGSDLFSLPVPHDLDETIDNDPTPGMQDSSREKAIQQEEDLKRQERVNHRSVLADFLEVSNQKQKVAEGYKLGNKKRVGKGGEASVYAAVGPDGVTYALKFYLGALAVDEDDDEALEAMQRLKRSVEIIRDVDHPFASQCLFFFEDAVLGETKVGPMLVEKYHYRVPLSKIFDPPTGEDEKSLDEADTIAVVTSVMNKQQVSDASVQQTDGDGVDVAQQNRRAGEQQVVLIGIHIACALHALFEKGFIHRDVKPANIMFTQGERVLEDLMSCLKLILGDVTDDDPWHTKVTALQMYIGALRGVLIDFGLARRKKAGEGETVGLSDQDMEELNSSVITESLTQEGALLGTPNYMAPEQIYAPRKADERTDLYCLAASLYHLATGIKPFSATNFRDLFEAIQYKKPVPAHQVVAPGVTPVSRPLSSFLMKAMAKNPDKRYQTSEAFIRALLKTQDLRGSKVYNFRHWLAERLGWPPPEV